LLSESLERLRIRVDRQFNELPRFQGSVAHLNQVFLNLLNNSIDAIGRDGKSEGRIVVTTWRSDDGIVVEISDNGCGIASEVLPKIFDPFFTTKPLGQGTGLGLSVSHGIVTEHGGRIEVQSQAKTGSCFRIHLPIRRFS
jgi:two-component system, NtrC family, sensor kinase